MQMNDGTLPGEPEVNLIEIDEESPFLHFRLSDSKVLVKYDKVVIDIENCITKYLETREVVEDLRRRV